MMTAKTCAGAGGRLWGVMRVILVTETLVFGGAETFVLRLARKLRQDGHLVDVLCLNPDFQDPRLMSQFPDVRILHLPTVGLRTLKRADRMGRWAGLDLDLQQRRAARWVERYIIGKYDIYHSHLFGADWLLTRLKRRRPELKIVSTLHGDYTLYQDRAAGTERAQVIRWQQKLAETLKAVDRWVTISREQRSQFETIFGVSPAKLVDIPNGYAPPAPLRLAFHPKTGGIGFVMVGRGIREKGWGFLIEAFQRLQADCTLTLVGEGDYLDTVRDHHRDDPRIRFVGVHSNPVEVIGQADVFVHPSIYRAESLPTVIIEALFAGLPVIATDIGEVPRMIETATGELAGILVSANQVTLTDDLAGAMQSYIRDPMLRRRHAALAPAAFAKFDMGKCAAAYSRLYAEVAGCAPSNSSTSASH